VAVSAPSDPSLAAPTVVMSGATSGIGAVAAIELARRGARIVFVARDRARAATTLAQLRAVNPQVGHAVHFADLSSLAEMRAVGAAIAAAEPRVDVLVNNAGAVFMGGESTVDGLAATFALNHLAYYVLTRLLLPRLIAAAPARVICTSSRAHSYARLDFARLQRNGIRGYAQSKLMNLLFARELARRLADTGVTVHSLHPGFVATRLADNTPLLWRSLMRLRKATHGLTPAVGADTLIFLATAAGLDGDSGGYFVRRARCAPAPQAQCEADARRLWDVSAQLAGFDIDL
jgi:NAD(P)-dependent dehydrogenase (short-subunit alcohol dehydrogenase family)